MIRLCCCATLLFFVVQSVHGQILQYPNSNLDYVYPAGGQRGQTVEVELGGPGGFDGAKSILIDGPPGVSVGKVTAVSASVVKATLVISPDAVLGRRFLRVQGGSNGLTNFRYFFVGDLLESMEQESNNTLAAAQKVATPVVINGRIDKDLDIDCYRFHAKAGQRLMLGLLAHGMDSVFRASFIQGYVDASLELLDEQGKVLAAADDTLGLDPVLTHTMQTSGDFVVRIQTLSYKGSASSVYRLTIGDVFYPTYAFPAGGQRDSKVNVEVGALNNEPFRRKVSMPGSGSFPLYFLPGAERLSSGLDLAMVRGEHPDVVETEPNDDAKQAMRLNCPTTVHGRIGRKGDEDWYRVALKKGQQVVFEVTAQRHHRSPIDTILEIQDAAGKTLAENDDGAFFAHPNQCAGDFASADSWLPFTPPADGDYLVRLRDQSGTHGPSAVYRLTVKNSQPAFALYQWPDAVPIWGPGTTASFIVEVCHWGLPSDIELRVEGLPKGWTGSTVKMSASTFGVYVVPNSNRALLTITAPPEASPGTAVPFRVIGSVEHEGRKFEREAQYMTLYGNGHNDRMFLRHSPAARAVVAGFMDAWPVTDVKELTVTRGQTVLIPIRMERKPGDKRANVGIVVNGPTVAAGCGLGAPVTLKADQDTLMLPLTVSPELRPGTRGIVIARSWSSDIRAGRPGPCTPLILLHVREQEK